MKNKIKFDPLYIFAAAIFAWMLIRFMAPAPPVEQFWPESDECVESIGVDGVVEVDYAGLSAPEAAAKGIKVHNTHKEVSGNAFFTHDKKPNYYAWTVYECKRREAQGHPGKEYRRYKDGGTWAIGYGCHIKYLNKDWQNKISSQGNVITEEQARAIMVDVLNGLVEQVKADLPNLTRNQQLAIASISFNWGYGNVKRSGLWKRIKDGELTDRERIYWIRKTQSQTENHRRSRAFEASLFMAHKSNKWLQTALSDARLAHADLQKRGDFKRY